MEKEILDQKTIIKNRMKGTLLGMVVGDALGAPHEFFSVQKTVDKEGNPLVFPFVNLSIEDAKKAPYLSKDEKKQLAQTKISPFSAFSVEDIKTLQALIGENFPEIQLIDITNFDYQSLSFTRGKVLEFQNALDKVYIEEEKILKKKLGKDLAVTMNIPFTLTKRKHTTGYASISITQQENEQIRAIKNQENKNTVNNILHMGVGGGHGGDFELEKGNWTDDASQGLCLLESFHEEAVSAKPSGQKFSPARSMVLYRKWCYEGHNTGLSETWQAKRTYKSVGLGGVISTNLQNYDPKKLQDPISHSYTTTKTQGKLLICAGNGSTMRCAAPAVYADSLEEAIFLAYQQSLVTTPSPLSAACAALMSYLSFQAIYSLEQDPNRLKENLLGEENLQYFLKLLLIVMENYNFTTDQEANEFVKIKENSKDFEIIAAICLSKTLEQPHPDEIYHKGEKRQYYTQWKKTPQAYVLDGPAIPEGPIYYGAFAPVGLSLALHALYHCKSFNETVDMLAKMRGDADSNAAVGGILAGAIYGADSINEEWVDDINTHALCPPTNMATAEETIELALETRIPVAMATVKNDQMPPAGEFCQPTLQPLQDKKPNPVPETKKAKEKEQSKATEKPTTPEARVLTDPKDLKRVKQRLIKGDDNEKTQNNPPQDSAGADIQELIQTVKRLIPQLPLDLKTHVNQVMIDIEKIFSGSYSIPIFADYTFEDFISLKQMLEEQKDGLSKKLENVTNNSADQNYYQNICFKPTEIQHILEILEDLPIGDDSINADKLKNKIQQSHNQYFERLTGKIMQCSDTLMAHGGVTEKLIASSMTLLGIAVMATGITLLFMTGVLAPVGVAMLITCGVLFATASAVGGVSVYQQGKISKKIGEKTKDMSNLIKDYGVNFNPGKPASDDRDHILTYKK